MCTMLAKKVIPMCAPVVAYRQELEYLYARRSAIDSVIESLAEYDRFRQAPAEDSKRRTA